MAKYTLVEPQILECRHRFSWFIGFENQFPQIPGNLCPEIHYEEIQYEEIEYPRIECISTVNEYVFLLYSKREQNIKQVYNVRQ